MNIEIVQTEPALSKGVCKDAEMACMEANPRYALWRRVTAEQQPNFEFPLWVSCRVRDFKRVHGLRPQASIKPHQAAFDRYLAELYPVMVDCAECRGEGYLRGHVDYGTDEASEVCRCCDGTGRELDVCHARGGFIFSPVCFDQSQGFGPTATFDQTFNNHDLPL